PAALPAPAARLPAPDRLDGGLRPVRAGPAGAGPAEPGDAPARHPVVPPRDRPGPSGPLAPHSARVAESAQLPGASSGTWSHFAPRTDLLSQPSHPSSRVA